MIKSEPLVPPNLAQAKIKEATSLPTDPSKRNGINFFLASLLRLFKNQNFVLIAFSFGNIFF